MEPFSLSLAAPILTEGIKCLVSMASDALKRWRQRRHADTGDAGVQAKTVASAAEIPADVLEGELEPIQINLDRVEELQGELREWRDRLSPYAHGDEDIDPSDATLLKSTDALRSLVETVIGQRVTFKGEHRAPSGPFVEATIDVGAVKGYVAGVRANLIKEGHIVANITADDVEAGGELVGIDVDEIGGPGRS